MLTVCNFTYAFNDELLYSIIGRYRLTDGNKNIKTTLCDLFNTSTIIPVMDIPCNIERLCSNIPKELGYNSDDIIFKYTLFPLYSPFMSQEKRRECVDIIKNKNGEGIKLKMGIIAGGLCKKHNIFYCPECAKLEKENYGEAYIHRLHQVQGVYMCEKHSCKLKEYIEIPLSRLQFNYINIEKIDYKAEYIEDVSLKVKLLKITEEVKYLLENNLSNVLDQTIIYERYYKILLERGYLTAHNKVKESKLMKDFTDYYGNDFLYYLDSNIDPSNESNWLKVILRKPNRSAHPIRHILLIDFLTGNIDNFIKYKEKQSKYTCLNHFCKYYSKDDKTEYEVTADYKTREPIVTVKCNDCGFTYSRKMDTDMYKIGRVKDYGIVWLNKLRDTIKDNKSLRAIAKEMKCDCKTVVKYAEEIGCDNLVHSNMKIQHSSGNGKIRFTKEENYKKNITKFIDDNPSVSIKTIRQNNYKEYSWLYRNDREWLNRNLPKPSKIKKIESKRVDWGARDSELLEILEKEYDYIKNSRESVRITKTLLARRSGNLSYIEKKLDKLPLCQKYLESVQESVEDYQIKRVDTICNELYLKKKEIIEWKVKKLAGLKNNISYKVQERIKNI